MHFLVTNDVETTSLELNRPADFMAKKVRDTGLPRLIDLYAKYDVEATFFYTGHIVEIMPEVVDMARDHGHEIACHGYSHEEEYFFDILPLDRQIHYLKKAKKIIENVAGTQIYSFRAPELRMNEDTIKALETTGFRYDSSIPPQRFDGPLSRGFTRKLGWMVAPRRPYYLSKSNKNAEGDSKILEIPISSFIFSYMGTTMRVSPNVNNLLEKIIFNEARQKNYPIVFLIHPTECIELNGKLLNKKTSQEGGFFSGTIRKRIKHVNVGTKTISLVENILHTAINEGFEFVSIEKYCKGCAK